MGTLVFQATLGGAVNIIGPNIANTINFTLPSADGTSGQTWTTNGSGVLAFGTLGIAGGGTGQITATAAFNALAPSQSGQSGKYLTTDGTNTSWGTNPLGTVTSVAVSGGTTGLTTSGGPITTSGTITFAGTLATANGGTNLTSFTSGGVVYASSSSALATGSAFQFNGTDLGLGVTPSVNTVSGSGYRQIEVGTSVGNMVFAGGNELLVVQNAIYNSGFKYAQSTQASYFRLNAGEHQFFTAPSGTAGNPVTFTQRMTLASTGNLGIGTTSTTNRVTLADNSASAMFYGTQSGAGDLFALANSASEKFRITNAGDVGIGTGSPANKLDVRGSTNVNGGLTISPNTNLKNTFNFTTNASNDGSLFIKSDTTDKVNIQANGSSYFEGGTVRFISTISVGNSTPSSSGAGLTFPVTQSASSDANTLDDYEEGTWTPALGGFSSITYSAQTGTYTKIGNVVNVVCKIVVSGGTRTSADLQIFSLPFTSASQENSGGSWGYGYGVVASSVGLPQLRINASGTTVSLLNTAGVVLAGTDLNTATPTINFSATYTV